MGASQSSGRNDAPAQGTKTSYYELLGIGRQASEDEIKKAYRRKALELHPDRNYGAAENATRLFAEVQAAHEVLSDPQERAWYDSHESAILRGDDGGDEEGVPTYDNVRITTADDLARMVRKFNSGVDFTDAPSGFFGYLRDTFEQLAKEEDIAAQWDNTEAPEYPTFGHKDDGYDDVVRRFYAGWASFATVKNFAWKDHYRLSEAPDRWTRRRMEQENKKCRQDGIREFNDAVRSLVAFIRKRDPRYVVSVQTEEERQNTLRNAAAAQAARARAANEAKLKETVPEWTKSREPDPLAEMEGNFDEEEVVEEQVLECVACNKIFKSERQWEAHEKSKKHQKAVYALQRQMERDEVNLDLDGEESGANTSDGGEEDGFMASEGDEAEDEDCENQHGELEDDMIELGPGPNKRKGAQGDLKGEIPADKTGEEPEGAVEPAEGAVGSDSAKPVSQQIEDPSDSSEDSDYASPETIQNRLTATHLTPPSGLSTPATNTADAGNEVSAGGKPAKKGKAAQKRAKKAAAQATTTDGAVSGGGGGGSGGGQSEGGLRCGGCDAGFESKTKLFAHLKEHPKHAALKEGGSGASGKKKKGKR
ncbi:hypothetical protein LTR08_008317 [Meristemomyces frigidus]|nr:hypothetical protein LTR08_008317 [Meristemomyces frigidus]